VVEKIKRITQKDVSAWLGIHPVNFGQFVKGRAGVSLKRLERFSKITGIGVDEILSLRGKKARILHLRFRNAYRRREE
jgi:plasmid maintenance system antidote protein VapI